jgi:hypothetical protein
LREKRLDAIGTEDLLVTLKAIWLSKPETARRVRSRVERILDAARVAGHRSGENPARWKGHLDKLLPLSGSSLAVIMLQWPMRMSQASSQSFGIARPSRR